MRSFLSIGKILAAAVLALMCAGCAKDDGRMDVIFDTDANNEIDDQHAIAYLLLNDEVFNTLGLTTNTTRNGGDIKLQTLEAKRVTALVGMPGTPIYEGADGSFEEILPEIDKKEFMVDCQALGESSAPVIITQSEYMRRMKDMARLQPGMAFYGDMPDMMNLVLNTDHPLIKKVLTDAQAVAVDIEIPAPEPKEGEKKAEPTKDIKVELKDTKVVSQLIDLALLQNGLLRGEALNKFVQRSVELI